MNTNRSQCFRIMNNEIFKEFYLSKKQVKYKILTKG